MSEAAQDWIDFCWQPEAATQISRAGAGLSPVFLADRFAGEDSAFPDALARNRPRPDTMQNSELLLPLPESIQSAYVTLWQQLRRQAV